MNISFTRKELDFISGDMQRRYGSLEDDDLTLERNELAKTIYLKCNKALSKE